MPLAVPVTSTPCPRRRRTRRTLAALTVAASALAGCNPGWVSPTGSDSNSCTSGSPCRSLERAYRKGHDLIVMKPGRYGGQTLPNIPGHRYTMIVGTGAKLAGTTGLDVKADNLSFTGVDIDGQTYVGGSNNLRFRNVDFGPSVDRNPLMVGGDVRSGPLEIVNSRFHDATVSNPSVHQECAWLGWIDGLTITGSDFRRCAYFDIFLTQFLGQPSRNVRIQNNTLCSTVDYAGRPQYYSVMIASHIGHAVNYRISGNQLGMPVVNDAKRATNVVVGPNTRAAC